MVFGGAVDTGGLFTAAAGFTTLAVAAGTGLVGAGYAYVAGFDDAVAAADCLIFYSKGFAAILTVGLRAIG